MLGRALTLATAMLLVSLAAPFSPIAPASAQNLEAGKSPGQLFAGNCSVCHKSARGLLKSVAPGQLPSFLRQHYTTSSDMAKIMSSYVIANGAGGGRRPADDNLTRQGRELSRERPPAETVPAGRQRPSAAERQMDERPDAASPAEPAPRRGRNARRQPPAETAAPTGEGQPPVTTEIERPAGQKQKANRKNRRQQEEPPKADRVKDEVKPDGDKPEPARSETPREATPAKPVEERKPAEAVRPEPKPETVPATRADPAPAAPPSEPAKPAE